MSSLLGVGDDERDGLRMTAFAVTQRDSSLPIASGCEEFDEGADMGVDSRAERAADDLLDSHWPGGSSDPQLPVDPFRIAASLGIDVYLARMDPDASGALVGRGDETPTIYLSAADSPSRQRFSCAHEIGHFAHYVAQGQTSFDRVEWRDARSATGTDPVERYANGVGAALMMPESAVRRLQDRDVYDMAKIFGTSPQAMGYRLLNLGVSATTTSAG